MIHFGRVYLADSCNKEERRARQRQRDRDMTSAPFEYIFREKRLRNLNEDTAVQRMDAPETAPHLATWLVQ